MLKSQATTYPPAYPRPLTPPGPTPEARPLSASPSPPPSPTPKTPRPRPNSSAGPPLIALVGATPMRPAATSPPKSPTRPPPVATAYRAAVTPLSRSTKAINLASASVSTPPFNGSVRATTTPKAVRERRTDGVIKDMKEVSLAPRTSRIRRRSCDLCIDDGPSQATHPAARQPKKPCHGRQFDPACEPPATRHEHADQRPQAGRAW